MNTKNKALTNPLIKAVIKNDVAKITQLLAEGADPNGYEDGDKITPLFFAVQERAYEAFCLLIEAGANIFARTVDGETLEDIARLHQDERFLLCLEKEKMKQLFRVFNREGNQ